VVLAEVGEFGVVWLGGKRLIFFVDFFLSFSTSLSFVLELLSWKTVVSLELPMFADVLRTGGGGGGGDVSDSGG
jgi:hypothetical protein